MVGSHLRDGSLLIDMFNSMLRRRDLFFPVGHNYAVGIGGYLLQGVSAAEDVLRFVDRAGRETPVELGVIVQRHSIADDAPVVILSALAFTDTEEQAPEQLAFLDSVRSQALVAETGHLTQHGAVELDESTDVPNEARWWIADNVVTDAGFDDMWPGAEEVIRTLAPAPSYLLISNWGGFPGTPERPPRAFSPRGAPEFSRW